MAPVGPRVARLDVAMRLVVGLPLLALGLMLGVADAFLASWDAAAGGAADVAARGPWLLGHYLPHLTAAAALVAAIVASRPYRRAGRVASVAAVAAAGAVLVAARLLYGDPAARTWQLLAPVRAALGAAGAAALDAVLVLAGGWLVAGAGHRPSGRRA
jgi:hypothetical protein